jgi:hypothetical protein
MIYIKQWEHWEDHPDELEEYIQEHSELLMPAPEGEPNVAPYRLPSQSVWQTFRGLFMPCPEAVPVM